MLSVISHSVIVNDTAPVQTESVIVDIAVCVAVATHVTRRVLGLFLDRAHISRHLERQECRRLDFSGHEVKYRLTLDVKHQEYGIRIWFDLARNRWIKNIYRQYDRFVAHEFLCLHDKLHIFLIDSLDASATVAAVRRFFVRVSAGDACLAGECRGVVAVL